MRDRRDRQAILNPERTGWRSWARARAVSDDRAFFAPKILQSVGELLKREVGE